MEKMTHQPAASDPNEQRRQPDRARRARQALELLPTLDSGQRTHALAKAILEDARRECASDIHLDPVEAGYAVRFRIDGILGEALSLPQELGIHLVHLLKAHAELDPGFALLPQDGLASLAVEGGEISVRVATAPGVRGEKVAVRLLDRALTVPPLNLLGLSAADHATLQGALQDVQGMILISGPTGSGKTTTLYALVRELARSGRSIVTIEDPVECVLDGVTQMHVNRRQGLTYAEGVKGLLRLDPDALVLGEMRDATSARAALDAADSGHIFLSTLHARDAAGVLSVLRNFGLLDHEIAATVEVLVAQRLVRRLCPACRVLEAVTTDEAEWLERCGQPVPEKSWHAVGCAECSGSGYRGRTGVFEVHRLREADADLILAHADERTFRQHLAGPMGLRLLLDDLQKVSEGITSLSEFRTIGGMSFFAQDLPAVKAEKEIRRSSDD